MLVSYYCSERNLCTVSLFLFTAVEFAFGRQNHTDNFYEYLKSSSVTIKIQPVPYFCDSCKNNWKWKEKNVFQYLYLFYQFIYLFIYTCTYLFSVLLMGYPLESSTNSCSSILNHWTYSTFLAIILLTHNWTFSLALKRWNILHFFSFEKY